jgi:hypothetical protein
MDNLMPQLCKFYIILCKVFSPPKEEKIKMTFIYPKDGGSKFY